MSSSNAICRHPDESVDVDLTDSNSSHEPPVTVHNIVTPNDASNQHTTLNNACENAEDESQEPAQLLSMGDTAGSSDDTVASMQGTKSVMWNPEDWVKACEFVPGQMWKSLVSTAIPPESEEERDGITAEDEATDGFMSDCLGSSEQCLYLGHDLCPDLVHEPSASICDLCGVAILNTMTEEEQQKHTAACIEHHEREMELSFAIQRSQEKACGICMDVVWEKSAVNEQRFGILSNCNHVFCLQCIRKWRSAKQFENKIVRACPECRVKSDFVTPSRYWVEEREDKLKLIEEYKQALSKKPCKYFDKGRGECPFNEKCFYLHALPDGRIASPKPQCSRRRRPSPTAASQSSDTAASSPAQVVLYEIFENWSAADRLEDLFFRLNLLELSFVSTSDDDDDDDSDLSGVL